MKRLFAALLMLCILLTGCGNKTEPFHDETVLVQSGAYTLSDGTVVDLWQTTLFEDSIYQTTDGVELLRIPVRVDIANIHVTGIDDFGTLSEDVRAKIRAFYEENWPELDIYGLLENAWSDYCSTDGEETFYAHYAAQNIYPSAENDRIIVFCVESMIPTETAETGATVVRNDYFTTIFDRQTGECIDIWELFSVDKAQAIAVISRKLSHNDHQYSEIETALKGNASIRVQQGGFEFFFPLGMLSWSEYDHYMYLDCEYLEDILYEWAITEKSEN